MRISNRAIAVMVFIFILISLANIFPLRVKVTGQAEASANATITVVVAGQPPEILSFYPLINPNITEEQNQTFNVSFTDEDDSELDIEWRVDDDIVKEETKTVPWPGASNYTFIADYTSAGQYNVTVSVSDKHQSVQLTWMLNVSNVNRHPYFNKTIPDISWYQGITHTMESLDNYATDPDVAIDDTLSYEIIFVVEPSQFQAIIDQITHEVFFRSILTFLGSEVVYFKVIDSYGAFNYSNNVTLTVLEPPPPELPKPPGGGGRAYEEKCENYWYCGSWGPCDPINNTRTRVCIDLAGCPVARNKPPEIENCTYIPTCYDGIKNGDEVGVDCGGPCPPCWTCYDGIKNQGEEGIDCGGPCQACATCYDGKRNCQRLDEETVLCEEGVDCGGPCPNKDCCTNNYWDENLGEEGVDCGGPCKECEFLAPVDIMGIIMGYLLLGIAVVILVITSMLIVREYRKKKMPIKESEAVKDLKRIYEGINKLEKIIDSAPSNKIIKLLSYITAKIIYYRFNVDLSCTEKELLERLSKIKKDKVVKDNLMRIYSRLYYLKFSGEEISKEELLEFIKKIKIINYLTMKKFYLEQKRKESKLAKKNPFFAKVFYYLKKGKVDDEIVRRLERELEYKNKEREIREKNKTKEKVIPLIFIVLIVAMVFSLFIIPQQQISKSGFATEKGISYEAGEVSEPRSLITRTEVSAIKARNLLIDFFNWLVRKIRILGRAPGIFPPDFIYPTEGQVFNTVEDGNFSLLIQGYDDDGDEDYPLKFSFLAEETETKFILQTIPHIIPNYNDTAGWINFTPTERYVYDSNKVKSDYTVTIVVKDVSEMSNSIWVVFNVTNINDAPEIINYTPASLTPSVEENKSITFWFNNDTTDPDLIHPGEDFISNEWYFNGSLNNTNVSWTYYPGFCDSGMYNITLIVTDSYNLQGNLTWELEVKDVIRPPRLNKSFVGYDYVEWVEGNEILDNITLNEFFEDVEAIECSQPHEIIYGYETDSFQSVDGTEIGIVIDEDTNVSFYPTLDWFGVQVIRYTADNGATAYSNVSITLNVTNVPDVPVLEHIPNQYLVVGYNYIYDVNATDPDNDVLYFSDNATTFDINESTGIINFTPMTEGTYSVNISVNDSMFTVSQVVNFTLYITNYPPNITMVYPYGTPLSNTTVYAFNYTTLFPGDITSINVTENTTMLFNQTSSDPEENPLQCLWYLDGVLKGSYSCANIPYWNYATDFFQDGIRNVTLVVDDGFLNTDRFTWNVSVANVNRVPTFGEKTLTSYSDFNGGITNQTSITESGNITLGKINPFTYYKNGTYISPAVDLKGHYDRTTVKGISWRELKPDGTNITFRIRISNKAVDISSVSWSDIYYNGSAYNIIDSGGRYIQFKVNMTTDNSSITPKVESVTINYEIKSMEITGNYQAWIRLDNFFDDKDGIETLNYTYEDIFGVSILGLSIDENNIVSLSPSTSGFAIFRFIANDSQAIVYSNNITLDVNLETPTVTIISTSGGGGGGGARRRVKIVPVPEIAYQQLIYVEPLQVINQTIIAPIILKNTGESILNDIYLSAETDMADISLRFERNYISTIDVNQHVKTNLYIKPAHFINISYSVDVIANVSEPKLQDISIININPLENITEKINLVRDLLQLHPICRELEEMVVKAQEALNNNRYAKSDALLTEVIEGCKYLVSSIEQPAPKEPLVIRRKWIFIGVGILMLVLLLVYFVPHVINRIKNKKARKQEK